MDLPTFLTQVIAVSLSGALAPGPLTASTATLGARQGWKAGIVVSVGHTTVELPLVLGISLGVLAAITSSPGTSVVLGLIGGVFLICFGIMVGKDAAHAELPGAAKEGYLKGYKNPLSVGITLSAFNPYFIIWWLGVGAPLIMEAIALGGFSMVAVFYVAHVWLDYVWLSLIASAASLSRLNVRYYRIVLVVLSALVVFFGIDLILWVLIGASLIPF